jgi:hypothetical protein
MTTTGRFGWLARILLVSPLLPLTACMATVGVDKFSLPSDAAQRCEGHCQTIGMHLTAVAIMAENVGCVCQALAPAQTPKPAQPPPSPPPPAPGADAGPLGTPVAGMATIAVQQAAAAALLAQQQQQRQQQRLK